jgi:hypothetical protein
MRVAHFTADFDVRNIYKNPECFCNVVSKNYDRVGWRLLLFPLKYGVFYPSENKPKTSIYRLSKGTIKMVMYLKD